MRESQQPLRQFKGLRPRIESLTSAFNPDGTHIADAGMDRGVIIWDARALFRVAAFDRSERHVDDLEWDCTSLARSVRTSHCTRSLSRLSSVRMPVDTLGQSRLYDELRRIAAAHLRSERANHTLQPTALVNEAYVRLMSPLATGCGVPDVEGSAARATFLGIASLVMRRVLVDHARRRRAQKRGRPASNRIDINMFNVPTPTSEKVSSVDLVELDVALARLGAHDERCESVLSMRYFGGMSIPEIAEHLALSVSTVEKDIRYALAWLARHVSQ